MAGDLMETFAHYAAKPLPCSVPLAVVLYGAGNHQPVVSRKVTFACDELEDFTDEIYVEKEKAKRAPVQKRDSSVSPRDPGVQAGEERSASDSLHWL